jgi:hypothetical protein
MLTGPSSYCLCLYTKLSGDFTPEEFNGRVNGVFCSRAVHLQVIILTMRGCAMLAAWKDSMSSMTIRYGPVEVEMSSRERYVLMSCSVLVRPPAISPSTLGSTNKVFTFPHGYPRVHRISCAQARICRRPAVVASSYGACGAA